MHNQDTLKYKNWPLIEAQKIFNKKILPFLNKKEIININFETGYGPSGLPHIGTFCEVFRTNLIITSLKTLIMQNNIEADKIKIRLICFSDDLDGLKKVPTNIPNQELIAKYIGQPLTSVPDAYEEAESYGAYMNAKLISFLDAFGMQYEFVSATKLYKSGFFNEALKIVMMHYDALMEIMLPTLGEERQKTYSPFLPICKKTNKVLQAKVIARNLEKFEITYIDENNEEIITSIFDGNVKLQWKVDFAMRWMFLGIDYEMYGKDHQSNHQLYNKLCKTLGGTPPMEFFYELFLDSEGNKISKSKGNSISIDEWLRYAPIESLGLYVMHAPERAKRLFFDIIPRATDEYIAKNIVYQQKIIDLNVNIDEINTIIINYQDLSKNNTISKNLSLLDNLIKSEQNIKQIGIKTDINISESKIQIDQEKEERFEIEDELIKKIEICIKLYCSIIDDSLYLMHNSIFMSNKTHAILNVPVIEMHNITFTLLLNLASACNPDHKEIMWGFIKKYSSKCNETNLFLDKLVNYAVTYYMDFIKPNKKYLTPTQKYQEILTHMRTTLLSIENEDLASETDIQNHMFAVGKKYYEPKDLRTYFSNIYQILLGQEEGPRLGSFIKLFGINNTVKLIDEKLKSNYHNSTI